MGWVVDGGERAVPQHGFVAAESGFQLGVLRDRFFSVCRCPVPNLIDEYTRGLGANCVSAWHSSPVHVSSDDMRSRYGCSEIMTLKESTMRTMRVQGNLLSA